MARFSQKERLNPAAYAGKRILFVGFHPDDIDFHCSGLAALLTAARASVSYLVVTSGGAGGLVHEREAEQERSAASVGVKDVFFIRLADGRLREEYQSGHLTRVMAHWIRKMRPEVVITFCPDNLKTISWGAEHPDHRFGALAVWEAVYPLARAEESLPFWQFWRKPLPGHCVKEIYWFGDDLPRQYEANCFVDVRPVWGAVESAIRTHESQWGSSSRTLSKTHARARRAASRSLLAGKWRGATLVEEYHRVSIP